MALWRRRDGRDALGEIRELDVHRLTVVPLRELLPPAPRDSDGRDRRPREEPERIGGPVEDWA